MVFTYPAVVHNDSDGLWLEFPDLKGCQTCAATLDELLANAAEALECYAVEELEYNGKMPAPGDINKIATTGTDFTTLIRIDADIARQTESITKSLTIPRWLNEKALAAGINFSKVLQEALVAKLA